MTAPCKCGFCQKPQDQCRALIAGPENMICDQCVMLCIDVLVGRAAAERNPPIPLWTAATPAPSNAGATP